MPDLKTKTGNIPAAGRQTRPLLRRLHRGRLEQVWIYLGKLLRMFVYQNDWKVLPMSALVAGLVTMVIKGSMFINMEGTLRGAFALACVGIWNGCFNSIQVVCRERDIVKREHRSGMHISSYLTAHAIYQAMLCLAQTVLTMYVCHMTRVRFPAEGIFTSAMIFDIGISMFLITYAADMMALFISCICHTTTAAMTIMPFILIFQLVFSGGMFTLPQWIMPLTELTVSNYGLKVIASQSDYNNLPMATGWNTLYRMRNEEVTITTTAGQLMDLLSDESDPSVAELRATPVADPVTAGMMLDQVAASPEFEQKKDDPITYRTTVGELIKMCGEKEVRDLIEKKTAEASRVDEYAQDPALILGYWLRLIAFSVVFLALSVIVMEFIDKDHR